MLQHVDSTWRGRIKQTLEHIAINRLRITAPQGRDI